MSLATNGPPLRSRRVSDEPAQKHPNSAPITTFLAEVKSLENDTGTAQQLAQDALRMSPDYKPAMVAIAHDHYRAAPASSWRSTRSRPCSTASASRARRATRTTPDAHLLRGLIEEEGGHRVAAMADFDAARKLRPDMVEALIHLGVMKLQAGNVQRGDAAPRERGEVRPDVPARAPQPGGRLPPREPRRGREAGVRQGARRWTRALPWPTTTWGFSTCSRRASRARPRWTRSTTAIRELETYRSMRGPKSGGDDVDELLTSASRKAG